MNCTHVPVGRPCTQCNFLVVAHIRSGSADIRSRRDTIRLLHRGTERTPAPPSAATRCRQLDSPVHSGRSTRRSPRRGCKAHTTRPPVPRTSRDHDHTRARQTRSVGRPRKPHIETPPCDKPACPPNTAGYRMGRAQVRLRAPRIHHDSFRFRHKPRARRTARSTCTQGSNAPTNTRRLRGSGGRSCTRERDLQARRPEHSTLLPHQSKRWPTSRAAGLRRSELAFQAVCPASRPANFDAAAKMPMYSALQTSRPTKGARLHGGETATCSVCTPRMLHRPERVTNGRIRSTGASKRRRQPPLPPCGSTQRLSLGGGVGGRCIPFWLPTRIRVCSRAGLCASIVPSGAA